MLGVEALRLALQLQHRVPVLLRQPPAHLGRRPVQAAQVGAQAERPVVAAQRHQHTPLEVVLGGRRQQAEALAEVEGGLQRQLVAVGVDIARQHHAQQPRAVVAALAVAAEPVEILHHPRGQVGVLADQVAHAEVARAQWLAVHWRLGQHPGVLAGPAALHRHHFGAGPRGDPGQAAGHHPVLAVGAGHGEHAHTDGARLQLAAMRPGLPHRRLRQPRLGLRHIVLRPRAQALGETGQAGGVEAVAEQRLEALRWKGRLDHPLRQLRQRLGKCPRLAAPVAGHRRQQQFLAEQAAAGGRQEAEQPGRLQHAAAQRVGHQHAAAPHRGEQARHAEGGVGAQLQRVAEIVVEAAQHRVHALQAAEGLQVQGIVAHRQVVALDQREAELTGEIQVLEVGFVEAPGGQQHHQRRVAVAGRLAAEGLLQGAEVAGQVLHAQVAVQLGEGARDDLPVLQRVAGAGRRLGAVGEHLPAAVDVTGEVHRVAVQEHPADRLHALARPEEVGMAEHQLAGQQALA
ncbi:hypothetical protein D9M69_323840 [compost metagenome]